MNLMESNYIKVIGTTLSNLKKALSDWIELYSKDLPNDFNIKLYEFNMNSFILIPNSLSDYQFFFLVNYLEYPINLKYEVDVKGYINTSNVHNSIDNQELLVYISKNDKEYDNVYAVTHENITFKIDFGSNITKVKNELLYHKDEIGDLKNPIILEKKFFEDVKIEDTFNNEKVNKRFKIYLLLLFIGLLIHFYLPSFVYDNKIIEKYIFFLGFVYAFLPSIDYQVIRVRKFNFWLIFLSSLFVGYGHIFREIYGLESSLIDLIFLMPLCYLVIEYPLVRIFNFYNGSYPKPTDLRRHEKISDNFYSIIQYSLTVIISFLICSFLYL